MQMRHHGMLAAATILLCVACTAAFGGSITYNYAGIPFTICSYGPCPGNFTSDYVIASATFASPLASNLPLTDLTSSLTGWTIGDALGNFAYSSGGAGSTYLTGYPSFSPPGGSTTSLLPLGFSTNGSGGIVDYEMAAFPAEQLGLVGTSEAVLINPTLSATCHGSPCSAASAVEIQWGLDTEWDAVSSSSMPIAWTETLNAFQGGTTSEPVYLIGGSPVAGLSGTISGLGAEDYYWFNWAGGAFSASASVTGASGDAAYVFSAGSAGGCSSVGSETLNSGDGFDSTISVGNLAAGEYCIGIDADSAVDPTFSLTFDTPVSSSPEPSTFVLLSGGLVLAAIARRAARRRTR
jgi:hypothetical protein